MPPHHAVSQSSEITIKCPECGAEQSFTAWNSLNVGLNPEKKTALKDGSLTRFSCESCGHSSEIGYPMLYHDPERQFMVWLANDGAEPPFAGTALGDVLAGYRLRWVTSRNQLVEKTHIFENQFDDQTMELFKASMAASPKGVPEGELLFAGLGKGAEDAVELQFAVLAEGGTTQFIGTTREAFEDTAELLAPIANSALLEIGQWHRIDAAWANSLLEGHLPGPTA